MGKGEDMAGNGDFKDKIKVMVSEPTLGWISHLVYDNRKDFMMELARFETRSDYKFYTMNTGRLMIQYARELICDQAVETDMDYVLFIDDDMMVPKDLFEHLCNIDADIVAPLCTARNYPYEPVAYELKVKTDEETGNYGLRNKPMFDIPRNEIVEVDAVGFGVVLIKVDTIKKIKKPRFFVNQAVGEDILFCVNGRNQIPGFSVKVNTGVNVGHLSDPIPRNIHDFDRERGEKEKFDKFVKERMPYAN
jgi:hypothetical protein